MPQPPATPEDILIQGALVIDGTGAPGHRTDVALRDGRIAAVGDDITAGGARVIEARGLVEIGRAHV